MVDCPVHDKRRLRFRSSRELKDILLQQYPLTKEFIDWIVEQGFKIVYQSGWKEGTGAIWWGLRQINVSSQGGARLVDKVLVHELIHISAPGNHWPEYAYEEVIDEIAEVYLNDSGFMEYLKRKIPSII